MFQKPVEVIRQALDVRLPQSLLGSARETRRRPHLDDKVLTAVETG
jgi:hypothetical protein